MSTESHVNSEEKLNNLLNALQSRNESEIDKAKSDYLWEASNLLELVVNYVFLYRIGVYFDFGSCVIQKGTKLFRIRSFQENVDFSDAKEWLPPPKKLQNRANKEGQEALYLGSTETVCYLETHMKSNQTYALGIYECQEDIKIGGFLSSDQKNTLYTLAAIVLNAFLIAPSRGEKNKELFRVLDSYFGHISLNDLSDIKNITDANEGMRLPYKFAVLNKKAKLYELTNQLCEAVSRTYPDGIRYSSCYIPLETPGIICSDYNVVLYSSGIRKMRFLDYKIKTFAIKNENLDFSDVNLAKILLEVLKYDKT